MISWFSVRWNWTPTPQQKKQKWDGFLATICSVTRGYLKRDPEPMAASAFVRCAMLCLKMWQIWRCSLSTSWFLRHGSFGWQVVLQFAERWDNKLYIYIYIYTIIFWHAACGSEGRCGRFCASELLLASVTWHNRRLSHDPCLCWSCCDSARGKLPVFDPGPSDGPLMGDVRGNFVQVPGKKPVGTLWGPLF